MTYELTFPLPGAPPVWEPDPSQDVVLEHRSGPLLVLAGPGTGKTATTVELVARRMEQGLPADQVLLLTFSRKAAEEVRERLALRLSVSTLAAAVPLATPMPATFHSFAWSLLRAAREPDDPLLHLLSGPEQDVDLRELLRGSLSVGRPVWPPSMREGLLTGGMAQEVQRLLAQARVLGLEPQALARLGAERGRPEWVAVAELFGDYLDALAPQGKVDYAELVHQAALLAESDPALQRRWSLVVVDEFQDTDAAQERLLRALVGPTVDGVTRVQQGTTLVVVGDPDQSIYSFRGADPDVLTGFTDRFADVHGHPARVAALTACRRSAPAVLAAGRAVASRLPVPLRRDVRGVDHRVLTSAGSHDGDGTVEVHHLASAAAEAEVVADLLRAEHLAGGTPWQRMAVLVRGAAQMPALHRAMLAAGVPVVVASDEVPLAGHPAVQPLLWALRASEHPARVTDQLVLDLLSGPLVGADPVALRRLARVLRQADGEVPRPGDVLLAQAVREPALVAGLADADAWPVTVLAELLSRVRQALREGALAALWAAWVHSRMQRRLVTASRAGGSYGRSADRDLDAVVALFAAFERSLERHGPQRGVQVLLDELEAQVIPADSLADRGVQAVGVRLLTAHRAKGLEWDVVVVSAVQEDLWPDLRPRAGLLCPEQLGTEDPPGAAQRLHEERRLFYVAITRARRRLVLTAARGEGLHPSCLLDELGLGEVTELTPRPRRPHTLRAHVAELRSRSLDDDPRVRGPAVAQLAALCAERDAGGAPLVPEADPQSWWDVAEPTVHERAIRDPEQPIALSGSQLEGITRCSLRWFLQREAAGEEPTGTAQGFGTVVHAIAEAIARDPSAAEPDRVAAQLDAVWQALPHRGAWLSARERAEAQAAVAAFVRWHNDPSQGGEVLAVEHGFDLTIEEVAGRILPAAVRLRGTIDRVARVARAAPVDGVAGGDDGGDDGQVVVQDLKTGKTVATAEEARGNPQLGIYQLAVDHGAVPGLLVSGAAELVYPRKETASGLPTVRTQPGLQGGSDWIADLLVAAADAVRSESFSPSIGEHCERCPVRRACPAVSDGQEVTS
jgi:superfamily I DNA/RNA helicase/RecB family exonuclease